MHNALVTAAGEKMSKSLGNGALVSEVTKRYPPRAVRFYLAAPHYRSAIEFSDDSLAEAAAALARIDSFVARAIDAVGDAPDRLPDAFAEAMDDDLGTPGGGRRAPQRLSGRATGPWRPATSTTCATQLGAVRGMLDVLGLDAARRDLARAGGADDQLTGVVDGLVGELLEQRGRARARKDFAAADAIRDGTAAAGGRVADTPQGPKWSLSRATVPSYARPNRPRRPEMRREQPTQGRGPQARQGQHRPARAAGSAAVSRARDRRRRRRTARTTRRTRPSSSPSRRTAVVDRPAGRRRPARTGRPGSGPEWVAGRNPVLEALKAGVPTKTAYVAEGAERDDRLRDILKLAADRTSPLLEVTRAELDRLTGGAVHQGVALQLPELRVRRTPTTCSPPRWPPTGEPLIVALDSITDPRNLGRDHPVGGRLRRPRRADPGAALGRHDRRRLEDLRRRRRPDAGRPGHEPEPDPASYADAGLFLVGLDGEADTDIAELADASGPLVLVVGSEGAGLSRLVRESLRRARRDPDAPPRSSR